MSSRLSMKDLQALRDQGSLRDVDFYLAHRLGQRYGEDDVRVLAACALASHIVEKGHVCLDLARYSGTNWPGPPGADAGYHARDVLSVEWPSRDEWIECLVRSPICGEPDGPVKPMVLVGRERLYLRRYYEYERRIAADLTRLAGPASIDLADDKLRAMLDRLVPRSDDGSHEKPRAAIRAALTRRLLIISGGPGTGKTHTLARLLVLLAETGVDRGHPWVIRMAAPTGKAAMRMRESIVQAKQQLDLDSTISRLVPEDAQTLHRLLGARPDRPHFRHHAARPLPADFLIIDEASMIDVPMMARLLDALKDDARLILLGDMHQLASVDPGHVLGDICDAARTGDASPLDGALVELTHNWRFPADGPVGRLAAALHEAGSEGGPEGAKAWASLQEIRDTTSEGGDGVSWHDAPPHLRDGEGRPLKDLRRLIFEGYRSFLETTTVAAAFDALEQFRILCALRRGPYGTVTLNQMIEEILSLKYAKPGEASPGGTANRLDPSSRFYEHRVIMVSRNDYGLRLFNGDIGIVMSETANDDENRRDGPARRVVWFERSDGTAGERSFRALPCHMLPEHETAFAMTIHKSQGSQFQDILVMLPPAQNPLLTKELIYTAVTRARKRVALWCTEPAFRTGATRTTTRGSGLVDMLVSPP